MLPHFHGRDHPAFEASEVKDVFVILPETLPALRADTATQNVQQQVAVRGGSGARRRRAPPVEIV